ncbi:MAG: hypothetical protein ABIX01_13330 [Chitinophagaceae bacterium]
MFPIDLHNADVCAYQVFYDLLIIKALYLICYNYFQSTIKQRMRVFKVAKILFYFVFTPLYLVVVIVTVRQFFVSDLEQLTLSRVYWKGIVLFAILVILILLYFFLIPTVVKGIRFLKKKDRNEVKYQSIYKKIRTYHVVLVIIDVVMLIFLNKVVG